MRRLAFAASGVAAVLALSFVTEACSSEAARRGEQGGAQAGGAGREQVGTAELADNSGVERVPYETVTAALAKFAGEHPERAEVVWSRETTTLGRRILGVRVEQRDPAPKPYHHGDPPRPVVLLAEAIHGNEYLHVADRLAEAFVTERAGGIGAFFAGGGIALVVPIANPDGYATGTRRNANLDADGYGVDLNRDFADPDYDALLAKEPGLAVDNGPAVGARFAEVETRFIRDFVGAELAKGNRSLVLTMGHHCCVDFLFFPWLQIGGAESPLVAPGLRAAYDRVGRRYADAFEVTYGIGGLVLLGTMDRYYAEAFPASINLTFEGAFPDENGSTRSKRLLDFATHRQLWDEMLGDVAGGTFTEAAIRAKPAAK